MFEIIVVSIGLVIGFSILIGGPEAGWRSAGWMWQHFVARPVMALLRAINRQTWRGLNAFWRWVRPHLWRGIMFTFRRIWQAVANVAREIAGFIMG